MTYFADLSESTMACCGDPVRAVGWLTKAHDYTTGDTDEAFQWRLKQLCEHWIASSSELGFAVYLGHHTCEWCGLTQGQGNLGVPASSLLYVAPEMVHHYVSVHRYRPPAAFVDAVMDCPLPGTIEYADLVRPFRSRLRRYDG